MVRVGIRELKQNATAVLKHVKAGGSVEVTERGRPVALIVPLPKGGVVERLLAEGKAIPAEGNLNDLPAPRPPKRGRPLPSEVLKGTRDAER